MAAAQTNSKVSVVLAPALVALFPGASLRLEVEARTVGEVIDALEARWPGMGDRVRDSTPSIRRHINIFCDGDRVALGTAVRADTCVYILTAVSGG